MKRIEKFRNQPHVCQREVFSFLTSKLSNTLFSRKLNLPQIENYEQFKSLVPLQDYGSLMEFIERSRRGEENLLWPGLTSWFAKSSGTTADRIKILPITPESLHENHYAGGKDLLAQYYHNLPNRKLYNAKHLIIGGSGKLDTSENGVFTGDLSAIIINNLPWWTELRRAPKKEIALLENWEEKLEKMARASLNENICIIAGVPSWTSVLIRRVLEISGKKNIHEVWPNLELYIHGGMNFEPYFAKFEQFMGRKIQYVESYNSSEGYFGLQDDYTLNDMLLLTDSQVFYEFIPMDKFNGTASETVLKLDEIQENIDYALVISTSAGLWRYIIGDTVRFSSINPYRFRVTGRTAHFVNAFGEKMIVEHTEKAVASVCQQMNLTLRDYTVAPNFKTETSTGNHEWIVELEEEVFDKQKFGILLDEHLKKVNNDYETKRFEDINIGFPKIHFAEKGTFEQWLKMKGRLGGQHKVPRVQNNRKIVDKVLPLIEILSV